MVRRNIRKASACSRKDIREMAAIIRRAEKSYYDLYFDIIHFMEVTLPKIEPNYVFIVEEFEEMGNAQGLTYPNDGVVKIRSDVYGGAVAGNGRDRLTIAHELFHFLQHDDSNITFARVGKSNNIKTYEDPEWQADAFGGELLVPNHLISGLSAEEIARKCGVSLAAARYQKKFCK